MIKSLAKILFVALPVVAYGQESSTDTNPTATDAHLLDSLELVQANEKIDRQTKEIEELKVEAGVQKQKYEDLQGEMQSVLRIVMPYAEAGVKAQSFDNSTNFDHIDFKALKEQTKVLTQLAPYSKKLKAQADTLTMFQKLVVDFTKCNDFDKKRYSDSLVNTTENQLLDIYGKGEHILNRLQKSQIDSLYLKVGGYRAAVEAFNSLITEVDSKIDVYRENEKASELAKEDFNAVVTTNSDKIAQIKAYRYLATLYAKYTAELEKSPRSRTESVRANIAEMLGIAPADDATDTATE